MIAPTQPGAAPLPAAGEGRAGASYGQILKSSALIGGSSVLKIGFGIIRTKAMALMLGPAGVGLLGLYGSIADLVQSIAGMGINSSGVRQIAEAAGTGETERIARTVITLRRVAAVLGALGALLLVAFCVPVSRLSFGDNRHAGAIALLALAVFFSAVSGGQIALVQGMRRIRDLAMVNVLGAFYGTLFGVAIVYLFGAPGIVPSLVCAAAMGIVTSWWYSRKIKVRRPAMRLADISNEVSSLLKLGLVFMASGLVSVGGAYLVRIAVVRRLGVEAAGFYQAAWALGGLYVGVILQAMGADFYPRLTAVAADNALCNRLVNEQAEVGLLLAGPGVLGTLTFAPLVIQVFYSERFGPAVEILRWFCLGMMLRVITWPLGFILLAKGERNLFLWSELASTAAYTGLVWACLCGFGLKGTGIAFFGAYIFYWVLIYAIARRVSGFQWSPANKRIGLFYGSIVGPVFAAWYFVPHTPLAAGGLLITFVAGLYSLKRLSSLVPLGRLPRVVRRMLAFLRLAPPATGPTI
jgi:PST family polysaccharide transporter